jgi:Ca-activated chloride channel homolog
MIVLAHPLWLLLAPLLLAIVWPALRKSTHEDELGGSAMVLIHPDLSPLPDEKTPPPTALRLPMLLNVCALFLLLLALAQPQRIGELIPQNPEGRDIVMLIDTSKTMSIEDFELNGQRVDRLAVLKGVVSRFVAARNGDRFGVIVFGTTAATLVPPSVDRDLVSGMVQQVQVGIAGDNTALGDALGLALKQLAERQILDHALRPALILFSDNTDNTAGELTPSEAVALAKRMGVAIYTVQVGSDLFAEGRASVKNGVAMGASLALAEEPNLQQIATLTGGRYYRADSSGALQAVVTDIGKLEQTVTHASTRRVVEEWYGIALMLAAGLLSVARVMQIRRMAA